ncbi:BA75_00130T0 [Komagataella pastoris]|uniref:BA75_00130T0 n=1 Tax=Komagataella pastoris TaxID=4922 RepID=A0A1B2J721_PICPA|nr:BA75_00130T0 [Komagataella pastoris]
MALDLGSILWYLPLKVYGTAQLMIAILGFLIWQPIMSVIDVLFYGFIRLPMSILFFKLLLIDDEKLQVHAGRVWEFSKIMYQFLSAAFIVGACVGVWLGLSLILVSYLLLWEKPIFTPFKISNILKSIAKYLGFTDLWSKIVSSFSEPNAEGREKTKRYVLSLTSEQLKAMLVGDRKKVNPSLSEGSTLVERTQSSKSKISRSVPNNFNKFNNSPRRFSPLSPKSSTETVNQNFQRPSGSGTTRTSTSTMDSAASTLTETSLPKGNPPVNHSVPPELTINPLSIPTEPFWRSPSTSDMQQLTETPRSSRSPRGSVTSIVDPQYDDDRYFTPIVSPQVPRSSFSSLNNPESSRSISDYIIPEEEE